MQMMPFGITGSTSSHSDHNFVQRQH